MPDLKPWPTNVFIVLAEPWGQENIFTMSDMVLRKCCDCRRTVSVDPTTIVQAWLSQHRRGRNVHYLCTPCCEGYDKSTINLVIKAKRIDEQHCATEAKS